MNELKKVEGFQGPLRVNPANPRYFTDNSGRAIYLTGSHTWANLQEIKLEGEPDFDYKAFLEMLASNQHNFMRMWQWGQPEMAPWTEKKVCFSPMPYARTGPGLALDDQPKFDLEQWNEAYFERLRSRVVQAGQRGIYVSVMFFEGWCLKWSYPGSDSWLSHPYNINNNLNGVDGDPDADGKADIFSREVPQVVAHQKRFIRKVIDTLNDLDHVLFEILNEIPNDERGLQWHYHLIDYIHSYEKTKPKQHPVGMTAEGGGQDNALLFASHADWISPGRGAKSEYKYDPPAADGSKVIISDTDHLWGHGGNFRWAWKSFLRGMNPIFMDPWQPVPGQLVSNYASSKLNTRDYPDWEPLRRNLGYTRRFAERMNLVAMRPYNELASSTYCLAQPGREYLVYLPDDSQVAVNLAAATGELAVEWFNPHSGETINAPSVPGGGRWSFIAPIETDAVLYVYAIE